MSNIFEDLVQAAQVGLPKTGPPKSVSILFLKCWLLRLTTENRCERKEIISLREKAERQENDLVLTISCSFDKKAMVCILKVIPSCNK